MPTFFSILLLLYITLAYSSDLGKKQKLLLLLPLEEVLYTINTSITANNSELFTKYNVEYFIHIILLNPHLTP